MICSFNNYTLPIVDNVAKPLSSRIPSGDTPAHAGGYQGRRQAGARTITVTGTLQASSYADLQTAWSDFQAAHDVEGAKALVVRDGWFYYATPDAVSESDVQPTSLHYQADYKLGDPYAYSLTVNTDTLAVGSTVGITGGGTRNALPTLTIVVSSAPAGGQIYIHNVTTDETCYLYPKITGTYVINSRTESFPQGGFDAFAGQFLSLAVGSNPISVLTSSGAAVSSATISWRNRSL